MGALGQGRIPDGLPWNKFGECEFSKALFESVAFRRGIGDDIAEGFYRAAGRWGRREKDLASGLLPFPHWGLPVHYDPRYQAEWGYGSILGDRDINEHCFNILFWTATGAIMLKKDPLITAEDAARIYSGRMAPFAGEMNMLDYSDEGIYSDGMIKLVAWHRGYTRFWKQSVLFCDFLFPDFLNPARDDRRGMVGLGEPRFLKAVTGRDLSFEEGIDLGRKIFTLDNAVWTLQGRSRDMVKFADYIHDQPYQAPAYMPGIEKGKWRWINLSGRKIDRDRFEDFKTRFYKFEGWDPRTGWALRKTLETRGLAGAATELDRAGKLPDPP
jgi:aldehyde:ferredoxin oxidoreductase